MSRLIETLAAKGAPGHMLAALDLLQFHEAAGEKLVSLPEAEWPRFLAWCDARQLSLMLPFVCGSRLPDWLGEQLLKRTARYELRFERLKRNLFDVVRAFNEAGLAFVMLKGLSHAPALTPDAKMRGQGDIDLWLFGSSVYNARDTLTSLGYVPLLDSKGRHLAPMGQPSSWKWRGDQFDPEMPISVELHYELWSEETERIKVPGLQQFWQRKTVRGFDGHQIAVLCDEDLLGFACLHFLLHLLHGELPLQRAWEIARFIDAHVKDDVFWASWRNFHPVTLRRLETCIFDLLARWFGCRLHPLLEAEGEELPLSIKLWLDKYYLAPLTREWAPNKGEIWLHLAFLGDNTKDKMRVLARRLLPTSLPGFSDAAIPQLSCGAKLFRLFRQLRFVSSRLTRHLITFFPTLWDGMWWFYRCKSTSSDESLSMRIR